MHDYQPINCEFHDVLESHATLRTPVDIETKLADGARQVRRAVITDVFSKNAQEYLTLDTGETIRLDALVSVNGLGAKQFG